MPRRVTRLSPPTEAEIEQAVSAGQEIIAISTDNNARRLFLKMRCKSGAEAVIWFDVWNADLLFRHLEKVFLGADSDPGSYPRLKMAMENVRESYGSAPLPTPRTPRRAR